MRAARITYKTVLLVTALLVSAFVFQKNTWAASGNVQVCQPSTSCHIGEFLFDDNYSPLTTTACIITSKYPDGTSFLNQQGLNSNADGWYSYDASIGTTAGIYRSQICCTVGGYTFATTNVNTGSDQITVGRNISTNTVITFSSTVTLPAGLTQGVRYYAINVSSTVIQVSATYGGGAIDLTSQGTGTHTINSDNMCLDKTFEVKADLTSAGIAASVWGYSDRSLSTFGTLIADIWNYSTRSLTTFGSLATDVWGSATRTLTGAGLTSGSLATLSDVNSARDNIKGASDKDLTQVSTQVTNVQTDATTIKADTTTLKSDTTTIKSDTSSIITTVNSIYTDTQALRTDVTSILSKWGTSSAADIKTDIAAVSSKLGVNTDLDTAATIFGRIEFVRNKWGTQTAQTIYDKANSAATTVTSLRAELDYNGKTTTAYQDLQSLLGYVDSLETSVGVQSDASTATTLFGRIKKVQDKVDTLSVIDSDLRGILDQWGIDTNLVNVYSKSVEIREKLNNLNISSASTTLDSNVTKIVANTTINNTVINEIKNEILTLRALSEVNRTLLDKSVNKPVITTFLLEGSVIFKSIIVNPSTTSSQEVDFIYYLPEEVGKEDILDLDTKLTLNFDNEKKQHYVTGKFKLKPSESMAVSVRTEDIWEITAQEIESIRKQADELYQPLVKSSYYGQAVTIKSDVDVSLDKVIELQKGANTPEAKIKAYREGQIELKAARTKVDRLKDLVSQLSSAGSIIGFVGGAQALAVWGLIIIMAAGFVFLALYLRTLRNHDALYHSENPDHLSQIEQNDTEVSKATPKKDKKNISFKTFATIVIITFISSSGIIGLISFNLLKSNDGSPLALETKKEASVLSAADEKIASASSNIASSSNCKLLDPGVEYKGKKALLIFTETSSIDLYSCPTKGAVSLVKISAPEIVEKLGEIGDWILVRRVVLDPELQVVWVKKEYVIEGIDDNKISSNQELPAPVKKVLIKNTPTGYLNVRNEPNGQEIAKVYTGESYIFTGETNGWIQIELLDGTTGWISKSYVTINAGKLAKPDY